MAGETPITFIGNLTGDPELRYTQNGVAVANFTVASTPKFFDKTSGGWMDKDDDTLFLRATVWKELAEHVASSLTKGLRVIVTGRLKQRSYETKEGEKRTSLELEVDEVGPSLRYATATVVRSSPSGTDSLGAPVDANGVSGTNTSSNNPEPFTGQLSNASSALWASDETPF